jgi:hypothetical protein
MRKEFTRPYRAATAEALPAIPPIVAVKWLLVQWTLATSPYPTLPVPNRCRYHQITPAIHPVTRTIPIGTPSLKAAVKIANTTTSAGTSPMCANHASPFQIPSRSDTA